MRGKLIASLTWYRRYTWESTDGATPTRRADTRLWTRSIQAMKRMGTTRLRCCISRPIRVAAGTCSRWRRRQDRGFVLTCLMRQRKGSGDEVVRQISRGSAEVHLLYECSCMHEPLLDIIHTHSLPVHPQRLHLRDLLAFHIDHLHLAHTRAVHPPPHNRHVRLAHRVLVVHPLPVRRRLDPLDLVK